MATITPQNREYSVTETSNGLTLRGNYRVDSQNNIESFNGNVYDDSNHNIYFDYNKNISGQKASLSTLAVSAIALIDTVYNSIKERTYDSIFNYKYKIVDNGYASVADIITASGIQNSTGIIYINGSNAWTNPECTSTLAIGTNPRLEAGFWYFDSMGTDGHYYLLTEISGNLAMTDVKDL